MNQLTHRVVCHGAQMITTHDKIVVAIMCCLNQQIDLLLAKSHS